MATLRDRLPALPRVRLFDGPSPLHRMDRLGEALGGRVDVWIKREDLLPLAFGGNKLRNLEFHLGAARAAGADSIVTSGRRWSNHCRLTAAAGARAGLAVHLVLSGPPIDPPGPNEVLDRLLGATVEVTTSSDRAERAAAVDAAAARLAAAGRRPYVIPVGGSGVAGVIGQVDAALEVAEQAAVAPGEDGTAPISFDALVLPSATGGTQAGLLAGLRFAGLETAVEGIAVAAPSAELRPVVARLLGEATGLLGIDVPDDEIRIDDRWIGAGYGRPSAAATAAAGLAARTEGIIVDPIYTAKALAGLVDGIRGGRWDGGRVLFWHAGGTPGVFEPLDP
ncbi:MAG TPA: pyridoxal-phosphate dependent enzyme [Candidatus Limnocylindrales bacterium]|nr:pyridoxal-phosphate dependent enzyme [Candidatus Limnocylindrales bacterium]